MLGHAVDDLRPIPGRVEMGPNETCIADKPVETACARLHVRRGPGDRAIAGGIELQRLDMLSVCRQVRAPPAAGASS